MTYEEAAKHPKGGAVTANPDQQLAFVAWLVRQKIGVSEKHTYNWAKRNGIDADTLWESLHIFELDEIEHCLIWEGE